VLLQVLATHSLPTMLHGGCKGLTEKVGLSMQLRSGTLLPNRRPQFFFHLICSTAILQPDLSLYGALSPAWQRSSSSA
ncbi:hypothetical protein JOQ06_000550, partial [Pogonophryne albipinna]